MSDDTHELLDHAALLLDRAPERAHTDSWREAAQLWQCARLHLIAPPRPPLPRPLRVWLRLFVVPAVQLHRRARRALR